MSPRFLRSVLFALAAYASLNCPASAAYPDRIIKIVVPFAPGGGTDVVARTLAQEMAKDLGASIIIENKPGAGTIIGTQAVATSAGDGSYSFGNLMPGTYSIVQMTQPAGYSAGKDAVGTQGGVLGNDQINQAVVLSSTNGTENDFGSLAPAAVSGFVYSDANDDGG